MQVLITLRCKDLQFTAFDLLKVDDVDCLALWSSSDEWVMEWHGVPDDTIDIRLVMRLPSTLVDKLDLNSVLFLLTRLKILSQSAWYMHGTMVHNKHYLCQLD